MKKNKVALILLLVVVLSCPAFSDEERCKIEFELGAFDASHQTSLAPWLVLSFFTMGLGSMLGMAVYDAFYEREHWWTTTDGLLIASLIGSVTGIAVSIAAPLATKPKPKVIPEHISKENVQCYLDGYALRARERRIKGGKIGCFLGAYFFILPSLTALSLRTILQK